MASRAGCKTIAGCLTLLQTWIYDYFPAFRPHPRRADVPNKTRAEMWSTQKPVRDLSRLRQCRSILDSMIETQVLYITSHFVMHFILIKEYITYANFACTQVEWTPYNASSRALLNEHPRTAFIGGVTFFDIVEVYLPERIVRQLDFVQAIPPPPLRPTQALRLAQGTYFVTFASTSIYTEAWSRFPYYARVGDQALSRASVPSEAFRDYVDWFRVCSHPFLLPGEGPNADFSATDSRVGYVSVFFICFLLSVSIT